MTLDLFLGFGSVILIVGVIVVFVVSSIARTKKIKNILGEQAQKRNGTFEPGLLQGRRLTFQHHGQTVVAAMMSVVEEGSESGAISLSGLGLRFPVACGMGKKVEVRTRTKLGKLVKFSKPALVLNNPAFDDAYVVTANDENFARTILTPGRQEELMRLTGATLWMTVQNPWTQEHIRWLQEKGKALNPGEENIGEFQMVMNGIPKDHAQCDALIEAALSFLQKR